MPLLVLIDRQGNIRYQHTGGETEFFTDDYVKQTTNLRGEIDKLMAEGQKPAASTKTGVRKKTTAAK